MKSKRIPSGIITMEDICKVFGVAWRGWDSLPEISNGVVPDMLPIKLVEDTYDTPKNTLIYFCFSNGGTYRGATRDSGPTGGISVTNTKFTVELYPRYSIKGLYEK